MAVGSSHASALPTPVAVPGSEKTSKEGSVPPGVSEEIAKRSATTSTEVTRTLGVHEDSPALAHLLGRTPKKRCINVYDEEVIDIFSLDKQMNGDLAKVGWRMSYAQRSKVDRVNEDHEIPPVNPPSPVPRAEPRNHDEHEPDTAMTLPPPVVLGAGSRFHVVSRICVEDRSLFIPQGAIPLSLSLCVNYLRSS